MRKAKKLMAAMAASLVAASACGGESSPPAGTASPGVGTADGEDSEPHYSAPPPAMCDQVAFDRAAAQAGLEVASWHDSGDDDMTRARTWISTSCSITAVTDNGQFADTSEFTPGGVASVTIHDTVAGARTEYDRYLDSLGPRSEARYDDYTTAVVHGWWDRGSSVTGTILADENPTASPDSAARTARLEVAYVMQHGNLFMQVPVDAVVPMGETDEAVAILRDLARAFADEFVAPLEPSG